MSGQSLLFIMLIFFIKLSRILNNALLKALFMSLETMDQLKLSAVEHR